MSSWQTKQEIIEEAVNGEFDYGWYIYQPEDSETEPTIVKIYDDGQSPGLFVVEMWGGEELGNHCYLSSYRDGDRFLPR